MQNVPTDTRHLSAGTTTKWLTPAPKLVQRVCGADIDWAARLGSRAAPTHAHSADSTWEQRDCYMAAM